MPGVGDRLTQQIVQAAAQLREAGTQDTTKINQVIRHIQKATFLLALRNQETETAIEASTRRRRRGPWKGPVTAQAIDQARYDLARWHGPFIFARGILFLSSKSPRIVLPTSATAGYQLLSSQLRQPFLPDRYLTAHRILSIL